MDEWAMGSTSLNSYYGPVKNALSDVTKLDKDWLISGGSSGGCAVAVCRGFADVYVLSYGYISVLKDLVSRVKLKKGTRPFFETKKS